MLYDDALTFPTLREAEEAIDEFIDMAKTYGNLLVCDVYDICDEPLPPGIGEEATSGWECETINLSKIKIAKVHDGYLICMPPRNINVKDIKEDKTMATTTNKTLTPIINCYDSSEELERDKKIQEATEEAEKKILDIRIELAKTLEAIRTEYQEQEAIRREERQAHVWKRRYDALLKEGFSVEQAWEMTMKSFEVD